MRSASAYIFLGIFILLLSAIYYYFYRRFVKNSRLDSRLQKFCNATLIIGLYSPVISLIMFSRSGSIKEIVTWSSFLILGFVLVLLPLSVGRDIFLGISGLWKKIIKITREAGTQTPDQPAEKDISRRDFLVKSNYALLMFAAGSSFYGVSSIYAAPRIYQTKIPIPGLPDYLEGFRIAQISDVHVGPQIKRQYLAAVVEKVNELEPHIIAVTGDLVDGSVAQLRQDTAPLMDMYALHGKYFITGNHEYYSGVEPWLDESERLGMKVLLNTHDIITKFPESRFRGKPDADTSPNLVIAGVPDIREGKQAGHNYDPVAAINGTRSNDIKILLAHQPVAADIAADAGYHLQISGHTHGGQFFPYSMFVNLVYPYNAGLYHHNGKMWVYVNRGTGFWGPPSRIGVPAEITLIKLTKS